MTNTKSYTGRGLYKGAKTLVVTGGMLFLATDAVAAIELGKGSEPVLELVASILGGAGIFLIGIHFAGEHFQQMAGGKFRTIVTSVSTKNLGAILSGIVLGVLTQSGKAIAFILADFVQVKLLTVRQSLPIVFWGNVGSSLIIFVSMLSIKVFALLLLGVTAFGLTFHYPKRLVHGYGALFGIAMIMYGLYLVKGGAGGLAGGEWFHSVLSGASGFYFPSLLIGLVLTLLVQSNLAVTMIAVALAGSGLVELEEAAMVMFGAQAGTGILTWIFSSHVKGRARQVVIGQIAFDATGSIIFTALFMVELLTGIPMLLGAARAISAELQGQAIAVAFIFQIANTLITLVGRDGILAFIETRFPPSAAEVLAQTEFLHDRAAESPDTALLLVEKEQFRLIRRLPDYIDYVRDETDTDTKANPGTYHEAFRSISDKISDTLGAVSRRSLSEDASECVIRTAKMQEQLVRLEGYVHDMTAKFWAIERGSKAYDLGRNIIESVDFMVLAAIDAIDSQAGHDVEVLAVLTQDRSGMMKRIRQGYFASESSLDEKERNFVLDVTMLLESIVDTLARYGSLLQRDSR